MNYFTILNHQDFFSVLNNGIGIAGQKKLLGTTILWKAFSIMKCCSIVNIFI